MKDVELSLELFHQAVDRDDVQKLSRLCVCYELGICVEKNMSVLHCSTSKPLTRGIRMLFAGSGFVKRMGQEW